MILMDQNKTAQQDQRLPPAETGNASNPSPHSKNMEPVSNNQLLDERAEKYLRESTNIEDEPDPQDQLDADEQFKKEK
jgi:hypothetical protein